MMDDETNILLAAALTYAELGYAVFPCTPGGKVPLTEHGFLDATTDPARIEAWWKEQPRANIGMATQGMLVVDADAPPGKHAIEIGLYVAETGLRLPVLDAAGQVTGDRILVSEVQVVGE